MKIYLREIGKKEAKQIQQMQQAAFAYTLEKYHDYEMDPAAQSIGKIISSMDEPPERHHFFVCDAENGIAIGYVRIKIYDSGLKWIGPLLILPEYQNQKFGKETITLLEKAYGNEDWGLGTILQEPKLMHFYESCGFKLTGERTKINDLMDIVTYKK